MKRPSDKTIMATCFLMSFIIIVAWSVPANIPSAPPVPSFEWNVQVGDTFTFLVNVYHTTSLYAELHNTSMTVQITALPDLSNDWNESEFTSKVLESMKISLVLPITHQNGTEINSTSSDSIISILSKCILPIGGWNTLDYYFPDGTHFSDYGSPTDFTYFSFIEEGVFSFGYLFYNYDYGRTWEGHIDQVTGVSIEVRILQTGMDPNLYDLALFLQPAETL